LGHSLIRRINVIGGLSDMVAFAKTKWPSPLHHVVGRRRQGDRYGLIFFCRCFCFQQRAAEMMRLRPNGSAPIRSVMSLAILIERLELGCILSLAIFRSIDPITSWIINLIIMNHH
jgi:hypothetical protein